MSADPRISDDRLALIVEAATWNLASVHEIKQMAAELQEWRRGPSEEQVDAALNVIEQLCDLVGTREDVDEAMRAAWHLGKGT